MRSFLIPTIAAAGLLALPAFSTTSLAATSSNSTNSSNSTSSQSMEGSNSSNGTHANTAEIQQNLKQDLSKAGYTDIQIIPGSFLVHAKDSKGNPTQMVVTPNSVTAVTAMGSSHNSNSSNSTKQ